MHSFLITYCLLSDGAVNGDLVKFHIRLNNPYLRIVLYLGIYKAPLAVMTIQRRFQRVHSEGTEKFSNNGQKWISHLPKSEPEFVGEGCSTKKDPQLQKRGVEQWLSWSGGRRGQLYH
jgi:hypothetical protein